MVTSLKPVRATSKLRRLADSSTQTNIVIDSNFRARLIGYGPIVIISNPSTIHPGSTTSPSVGTARYMAPEPLNPAGFNLKNSNLTKKSEFRVAFGTLSHSVGPHRGAVGPIVKGKEPVRYMNIDHEHS